MMLHRVVLLLIVSTVLAEDNESVENQSLSELEVLKAELAQKQDTVDNLMKLLEEEQTKFTSAFELLQMKEQILKLSENKLAILEDEHSQLKAALAQAQTENAVLQRTVVSTQDEVRQLTAANVLHTNEATLAERDHQQAAIEFRKSLKKSEAFLEAKEQTITEMKAKMQAHVKAYGEKNLEVTSYRKKLSECWRNMKENEKKCPVCRDTKRTGAKHSSEAATSQPAQQPSQAAAAAAEQQYEQDDDKEPEVAPETEPEPPRGRPVSAEEMDVMRSKAEKLIQKLKQTPESVRVPQEGSNEELLRKQHAWNKDDLRIMREEVREMFFHGYNNYMAHAYPYDELAPLSCKGYNVFGQNGFSLTFVDALDTLAIMGHWAEFEIAVKRVCEELTFDIDLNVSVFEITIRGLGGLIAAHMLAREHVAHYDGRLLVLALDLGDRLLPAFSTPTGIPYGTVNLKKGVPQGESHWASTAGAGSLILEFTYLSRLSGRPEFEEKASHALMGLWTRRSPIQLVGSHIDIFTGQWTHQECTLGVNVDSFYEYLLKYHLLFHNAAALDAFHSSYRSISRYLKHGPWYVETNMFSGQVSSHIFSSLASFWPGAKVLVGAVDSAAQTSMAIHSIWRAYGGLPEGFNLQLGSMHPGQEGYPLRPESVESLVYLYAATKDPLWLTLGRDVLTSLQALNRVECGFAATARVGERTLLDRMDSYFLAETCKYLYLLFDENNPILNGTYVFNTEAHPLPILAENVQGTVDESTGSCSALSFHRRLSTAGLEVPAPRQKAEQKSKMEAHHRTFG